MMYKFVWQNVDDEHHVRQDKLNKEPLAHYLSDLHEDLCENGIIIDGENLNPVLVTERIMRSRLKFNLAVRKRDIEYTYNPAVPKVDWEHAEMTLTKLLNNNEPFPLELTAPPPIFVDEDADGADNTDDTDNIAEG
ncbi:hypothetical protein BD408DRAFT_438643 [Parasitella parasitica]|nr:hypothetical protein BD408DRAFT_438643 [Parasitella parasitica]